MLTGKHKTDTAGYYRFKVLLFLPGMSPSGIRARLGFRDGVLEFKGPGVWITLLADQVSLGPGGFDGRQWVLSWNTEAGPASALLKGDADMRLMRTMAPPVLARQIEQGWQTMGRRDRRIRWLIVIVLTVILLALLAIGLYWGNSERLADWTVGHIGLDDQQRQADGEVLQGLRRTGMTQVGLVGFFDQLTYMRGWGWSRAPLTRPARSAYMSYERPLLCRKAIPFGL